MDSKDLMYLFTQSVEQSYNNYIKRERELEQVLKAELSAIKEDIEKSKHQKPNIIMYKRDIESVVDPSYIYDKRTIGVHKAHLFKRLPKNTKKVLEVGFLKNGQCLYEKYYDTDRLYAIYIYIKNKIYRVRLNDILGSHIYEFDENNVIKFIQRGCKETETYQWLNENIALVRNVYLGSVTNLLMIKDGDEVLVLFEIKDNYNTNGIFEKKTKNIIVSDLIVQYSSLIKNGKNIFCHKINCLDHEYIGWIIYMKPPKGFRYKNAKELFKKIVLDTIQSQIKKTEFTIETIGILYMNEGNDIDDMTIGFDDIGSNNDDIMKMKKTFDIEFDAEAENISFLNEYIKSYGYYSAFRKVIYQIKDELEKEYKARVVLVEIND
ncbi:MAG: hypothetical protein K2P09_08125 [Erysipelotrichales bacterium]|nr:hypothetical protein [Erysipelotrichales bacterium]